MKTFLLFILIHLNLFYSKQQRGKRNFSFFSVITFPNLQCTSQSDNNQLGTCLSATDCGERSGTEDGNCASGFGVCCIIGVKACGGTVTNNLTYIMNPSYSGYFTTKSKTCAYTIKSSGDNVCQLRLDFVKFVLNNPPSSGDCSTSGDHLTVTQATGGRERFGYICGTNSGQHMYLETGQQSTAGVLTITTGSSSGSRLWKILVSQIDCESNWKAPNGCLQYHTGVSGVFESWNYGNQQLQYLAYTICFREEEGFCKIAYATNKYSTSDPFTSDEKSGKDIAKRTQGCRDARLEIRLDATGDGDIFCGQRFNSLKNDVIDGIVYRAFLPFRIYVITETAQSADGVTDIGFALKYYQLPCGVHDSTREANS